PPNHGRHRYYFRLYALDTESLDLSQGAKRGELDAKMQGHVLAEAELMGTYERKPG
ncbi:MAG: YbhB/YbcL family Raf kinase inhibitor-like protein, partial [Candidatus Paceibacterota bacterium]